MNEVRRRGREWERDDTLPHKQKAAFVGMQTANIKTRLELPTKQAKQRTSKTREWTIEMEK